MPRTISSVINASLSLQLSSHLNHFRRCLRYVIKSRIKVVPEGLSEDAVHYKRSIMKMFFSTGPDQEVKRVVAACLPRGDWRNTKHVEVCLTGVAAADIDMVAVASIIENGLSFALLSAKPTVWPRHRWTGSEIAVDFWGRLEAVHGLASATYPLFCRTLGKDFEGEPRGDVGVDGAVGVLALEDGDAGGGGGLPEEGGGVGPSDADPVHAQAAAHVDGNQASSEDNLAAKNAKNRQMTLKWLAADPLPDLMLLRCALNPIVRMLREQLDMAGLRWELSQRAAVARSLEMGGLPGLGARDYRVLCACEQVLEKDFFKELNA
eukprot:5520611-Pyramimonas_sp.AAC.1